MSAEPKDNKKNVQRELDEAFEVMLLNYKYSKGIKFFERYFSQYPFLKHNPKNLTRLGLLYDHAAMVDSKERRLLNNQARQYYQMAISLDPDFYSAWWGLGRIFWHQNDKRSLAYAKKAYRLAKKKHDDTLGHYSQNIALIYKGLGNLKRAEFWFKRGLKESPQEWGMVYNFMRFYINAKPDEDKARKFAKRLKSMLESKDRNSQWLREVYALAEKSSK